MLIWDESSKLHRLRTLVKPQITNLNLTKSVTEMEAAVESLFNTAIILDGMQYRIFCYIASKSPFIYKLLLLSDGTEAPPNWRKVDPAPEGKN